MTRPQRVWLWKWKSIPPRFLGFLLRLFLSCKNETEGVLNSDKVVVKDDEVILDGDSKRFNNDREYTARKRVKTFNTMKS